MTTYFLNNKPALERDVKMYKHFVSINDDHEKDVVHVFETSEDLERWTASSRYAMDFANHLKQIREAQKRKNEDHTEEEARLAKDQRQVASRLEELSKELKLPLNSLELTNQARSRKILSSFIVYSLPGEGGSWRVGHWPIPDYNWIGFDNMSRSIIGWGLHSFYRGSWWPFWDFSWWLVGFQQTNLPWWIDGQISSSW